MKRFEQIVSNLNKSAHPGKADDEGPSLDELAVAVALWALQRGHTKEETIVAISNAFTAIEEG